MEGLFPGLSRSGWTSGALAYQHEINQHPVQGENWVSIGLRLVTLDELDDDMTRWTICDIAEAKEFGKLLWATGCALGADRARLLVFICDGAVWIWNLIAQYFPNAIQIVDWCHAADHLKRIAEETFPNWEERQTWLKQVMEDLWQGRVELVIEAC